MFKLRYFQQNLQNNIFDLWNHGPGKNVLAVSPTGSGKTVLFSDTILKMDMPTIAIAHRQELVGQMSLTFAKFGIYHRIIAPAKVIRIINQLHVYVLGKSFYDPSSKIAVAGINTLTSRARIDELKRWLPQVKLWILDEAHHLLKSNVWGRGIEMLTNAEFGLGVTATPLRADGAGLGRHHDGLFDYMVQGPIGRELIDQGFLSDYIIYAPPCNIDFSNVNVSKSTGDFVNPQLVKATRDSPIVGDIVEQYIDKTLGKLGITFLPSVDLAQQTADRFNALGVHAKMVSANTPDIERAKIMKSFEKREILQLVNVDLFGEGTDIPALEVVSMGRKTQSYGLFVQQFGRVLRTMEGKDKGVIIDHVNNVLFHAAKRGLPDTFNNWSLDRVDRKKQDKDPDLIPLRTCTSCSRVYEAFFNACPYCKQQWIPAERSTPEQVEGDLVELDHSVIAALRGEISKIDTPDSAIRDRMQRAGQSNIVAFSAAKRHRERQEAQEILRQSIAQWAGYHKAENRNDSEIYKRFYHRFNIDVMSAQCLGRPDAEKLNEKINSMMGL